MICDCEIYWPISLTYILMAVAFSQLEVFGHYKPTSKMQYQWCVSVWPIVACYICFLELLLLFSQPGGGGGVQIKT